MWKFPWKPTGTVLLASLLAVLVLCAVTLAVLLLAFRSRSATDLLPAARVVLFVAHPQQEDLEFLSLYAGVQTPAVPEIAPEAAAVVRNDNGTLGMLMIVPMLNVSSDWSTATLLPYTVLANNPETLALAGRSASSLSWSGRFRQWQHALQNTPHARWWYGEREAMLAALAPAAAESLFLPKGSYLALQHEDDRRLWLADSSARAQSLLPAARLPGAETNVSGASLAETWHAVLQSLPENDRSTLLSRLEHWTQSALPGISLQYELVPLLQEPSRLEVINSASGSTFVWQFLLTPERAAALASKVQKGFSSAADEGELRALQLGEGNNERSIRPGGTPPEQGIRQDWTVWQATDPASGRTLGIALREGHILLSNSPLPATLPAQGTVAGDTELHVSALPELAPWSLDFPWHVRLFGVENRSGMLFSRTREKAQESLGSPKQTP